MSTSYHEGGSLGGGASYPGGGSVVPPGGDYVDLHELAKGWKAAIARAKDPATRLDHVCVLFLLTAIVFAHQLGFANAGTKLK